MIELPAEIDDCETLGRCVFDGKVHKAAQKGNFHPRVFIERDGIRDLSVDRLSFGGLEEIATYQDRQRGRPCHGWAAVSAAVALQMNRQVKPDPVVPQNPYHALIVLPSADTPEEFVARQREHGVDLAMAAHWCPRPTPSPRHETA
jgi:hypothetical protein